MDTIESELNSSDKTLFLGIDLGTYKTSICASNGFKKNIRSLVGWPKDVISRKMIGQSIVLGSDVLEKRLALEVFSPLENGIIRRGASKNIEAAKELLNYLIKEAKGYSDYTKVVAVIGTASKASVSNKQLLIDIMSDMVDSVIVVSNPFAIAYGSGLLNNSLIIDMGAGTIDVCRMHGTIPDEEDQSTILKAGNHVDKMLHTLLLGRYPDANLNLFMVQKFKERFASLVDGKTSMIELLVDGRTDHIDISSDIEKSCMGMISEIVSVVSDLVSSYDPEYQIELKNNIFLTGGLSQIEGIELVIEKSLSAISCKDVKIIDDSSFVASDGSLKLAVDMDEQYWQ